MVFVENKMFLIALSMLALAMVMTGSGIEFKMELYVGPFVEFEDSDEDEDLHED